MLYRISWHRRVLVPLLLLVCVPPAFAVTHEIIVENDFFSPSDLTIQVGDTVRWVNPAEQPQLRVAHNVVSQNNLWASFEPSAEWVFEYTFTNEGEFDYFCDPHRAFGMEGTITVQSGGGGNQGVNINAGLNDAWYDPATPGQGFFFNVFPDLGLMFVAWFTYDVNRPPGNATATLGEPGHRWVTGIGPFAGDTANISLELTQGGVFDSGNPPVAQTAGYGSLDLEFHDCSTATATYNIPAAGVSGSIDLQRIVSDNVPLCESLAGGAQ